MREPEPSARLSRVAAERCRAADAEASAAAEEQLRDAPAPSRDPVRRADRRDRRRQVDGARGARALGAAVLSTDRVVHELYETTRSRRGGRALRPDVAPDGVVDRAALAGTRSRRARTGAGSKAAAVAAGRGADGAAGARARARVAAAAGGGRRGAAAVRVGDGGGVRRDDRGDRRRGAAGAAGRGRGHQALDERLARQLTQQEKAQRATYVRRQRRRLDELEAKLSAVLDMLER